MKLSTETSHEFKFLVDDWMNDFWLKPIGQKMNNPNNFTPYSFNTGNLRLKYCCDLDKDVLSSNFDRRGWTNVNQDEDWNFYW